MKLEQTGVGWRVMSDDFEELSPPFKTREQAAHELLRIAALEAAEQLGVWLTNSTKEAFEEEPEIDGIRADLYDALETDRPGSNERTRHEDPARKLLRAAQYAFNDIPNKGFRGNHPDGYRDTYEVVAAIDEYFRGRGEQ